MTGNFIENKFDLSNLEVRYALEVVNDSYILEDIKISTDAVEIVDDNFDSQFILKNRIQL